MCSLKTLTVNRQISQQAVRDAITLVTANHEVDKSCPSEKYYCCAVIERSSINIEEKVCEIALFDSQTKTFFNKKQFDLSFLPPELLKNAKHTIWPYVHVLVCKKIFYYSQLDQINQKIETTLIVPIGEIQIGYHSNDPFISEENFHFLKAFYDKEELSWNNRIPLPAYSDRQSAEEAELDRRRRMIA